MSRDRLPCEDRPREPAEARAMRVPRVRPTILWLMAAVAVAACVIGGVLGLARRRDHHLRSAHWHASYVRRIGAGSLAAGFEWWNQNNDPMPAYRSEAREAWHRALMEKYQSAADRPWLPVAPDPPDPSRDAGPKGDATAILRTTDDGRTTPE